LPASAQQFFAPWQHRVCPAAAEFLMTVIAEGRAAEAGTAIASLAQSRFRDEFRERVEAAVRRRDNAGLTSAFQKEFARGLS
jgi:hypothetical protein